MAQLKIMTDEFRVTSTWSITTGSNGELYYSKGPYEGTKTVTFSYEIPEDSTIIGAKVHSVWGATYGPIGGYADNYPKVAGVTVRESNEWMVDISIDPNMTSIDVDFVLKVIGTATSQGDKSSSVDVTDVYLLIEYEPNYSQPDLIEYTDSDPIQGETYVKAVHMTELHTNINLVRVARKLAEYEFTSIVAMETSLAGWNNHVLEIRSAIDEMNITPEEWIELGKNYPRLNVLLQLRRVAQTVSRANATDPVNPNVLIDGYTGATYELSVRNGKLTMTEVESSNPSPSRILVDTETSLTYKIMVADGDLIMFEFESDTPSEFDTFTDTVTSIVYKLEVVNGDLTMSEA